MANYTTTADIVVSVNGKQAQQTLVALQKHAANLEKQIAKVSKSGDPKSLRSLHSQLNAVNKTIDQMKAGTRSVDEIFRRLDKASPRELNKALKELRRQMNGIERGSAAWDAHVAKIKAVKEELNRVNAEMAPQRSLWSRMNGWLNNCQTALVGIGAAITGVVMAGRKAVNAYAEMEQEMANVQKFTGMTADEVATLNEQFKKIDTRTSREDLNKLAQEAGRLGKSSQEDVLGFVRAADKINVALNDLGEGATLTLSKLTGIFGDEERLGTEQSLLAVGSVINELSQNCSASAPYLAEFASRMGGVGSQAGMSVQQIMGFAAVLDSNNQKLEASSTALSQVIVRIYQDPAKYARVAGMDVERFSNLVKTDMNAALIEFLSTLKQAGNMDVLSPMFKDMGENGSRAISALSTLANHIDEVKSQQLVANEAFEEATSIDKEFNVQNNTVQAGLDKAKNRVNELAVELGEKLAPVMAGIISSSTLFLKALSGIINFVAKYKSEILVCAAAIGVYTLAVNAAAIRTAVATTVTKAWGFAVAACSTKLPALRLVIVALTNAVQYFTNGLRVNYAMQERWRNAMAAMKFSSWTGLILAAGAALYVLYNRLRNARKAAIEQAEAQRKMADVSKRTSELCGDEIAQLKRLYSAAMDESKAKSKRIDAANKLISLYPEQFKNMSAEQMLLGKAKTAYDNLTSAIIRNARAKAAAEKIKELQKSIIDKQLELEENRYDYNATEENIKKVEERNRRKSNRASKTASTLTGAIAMQAGGSQEVYKEEDTSSYYAHRREVGRKIDENKADIKKAEDAIVKLSKLPGVSQELEVNVSVNTGGNDTTESSGIVSGGASSSGGAGGSSGGNGAATDKFAAERDWREQQEASARISYATGETDYITHTKRMNEIAVKFYEKQLQHTDLTEEERLKITADWREAQKKQKEQETAESLEAENDRYNTEMAQLKQFYLDGKISKNVYDTFAEEAEMEHQHRLVATTKEGSKERLQAEQQLQSMLLAQMQRKQQEREQLEAKYAAMKKDYFGDNPQEALAKYDDDLRLLDVVYQREIAAAGDNAAEKLRIDEAYEQAKLALKKKYGVLAEEDNRNVLEKSIADSIEWLNSDGGKALTGTLDTLVSGMSAVFSQLSSLVQAELEIQTAAINRRYDAEINRAEGNSYLVKKLEKQKEKEIAKAKNEANRKMFAMQVIQAVAQTATNALNAYGSAAAIPVVGYILAPIAAAMAVAAGAIQIAAIKKQQQASESQGYSEGGFTPEGKPDDPAGIVHKGEWVASQKLLKNPSTRPLINALDYAQRTNTIGSITNADVSRSITAPMVIASQQTAPQTIVNNTYSDQRVTDALESLSTLHTPLSTSIARLNERLNEPFVTVNTVSGDYGIQKAQDDYDKLMRNKSPKSRK